MSHHRDRANAHCEVYCTAPLQERRSSAALQNAMLGKCGRKDGNVLECRSALPLSIQVTACALYAAPEKQPVQQQ